MSAIAIAASGMKAAEDIVTNTAHTLANASTTGFKKFMVVTQAIMPQTIKQAGTLTSPAGTVANVGTYFGGGVRVAGTIPILTQGNIANTGRDTDLAIAGNGYFQIEMPDGTISYTRDGTFTRGRDGTLETIDGYKILPGITVPEETISLMISRTGEVEAKVAGQTENQKLGQIQLAIFTNPSGLEPLSGNYLAETGASGAAIIGTAGEGAYGQIYQRALESSNVEAVTEVVSLIKAQQGYGMVAKTMQTWEEMQRILNNIIR
jgi:flagellar basal-body rod protein FlgG